MAFLLDNIDFPKDLPEFEIRFNSEESCRQYLFAQRWPDGFACPGCGHPRGWLNHRQAVECSACHRQTSLTAGTILHGTRAPLRLWFRAMWWVCTQKTGLSAAGLKRILGLGSMQTAWVWLQKLRQAMVRIEREPLAGRIQVDLVWLAEPPARRGQGWQRARIGVAVETDAQTGEMGRIRLTDVSSTPEDLYLAWLRREMRPGSVLVTDGWTGYDALEMGGWRREVLVEADDPERPLPQVRRVVTLVRRWLLGTHQGRVSQRHLQGYLDEFVFRYNRRKSPSVGLLFQRLVSQSAQVQAITYGSLVSHERSGKA